MNDLLTTRQVQDLLKVDRITIYRMLQDGRLKGVKIGQQWRFPQSEVERMVGINLPAAAVLPPAESSLLEGAAGSPQAAGETVFPVHCVQTIQDLFSDISQISAVVVDRQGRPVTEISRGTRFCQLLMASAHGKNACQASWHAFVRDSQPVSGADGQVAAGARFFTCQAGLQYVGAPIYEQDRQVGLFLAGQFYWQPPDPREETERIRRLAAACGLAISDLQAAAREIPVIDPAQHARVESWPFTAAKAVQSILHERLCFVDRLQQIASLTHIS